MPSIKRNFLCSLNKSFVLLVYCCSIRTSASNSEKSQKCKLSENDGICKSIYECPKSLNDWKQNVSSVVYCSEEDQIVCCENEQSQTTLRKSEKKCLEYLKYTFEQTQNLPEDPEEDDLEISFLDRCGISAQQYSIVGGEDASLREYPHMAAIGDNTLENFIHWFCAGSIISEYFVITAAHCIFTNKQVNGNMISPKIVKLGALNVDIQESTVEIYQVEKGIIYPDYRSQFVYNDIGLLKLRTKVQFNINIRPICLAVDKHQNHDQVWAIGWGSYKNASYEGILQKLQLPLVSTKECSKTYNAKRKRLPEGLKDSILCYGAVRGIDTCPGASGGPIQVVNSDIYCSYSLVGVTSAGVRCTEGYPGLFTKVSEYLDWIETTVWG
ncbi:trypsin-1-like [Culicoides brevitarsis]|uniref:trypsin-1-like n=1 Tax=Culicoides brevitarsis TaxID=469753 RepID=UPI00307C386D